MKKTERMKRITVTAVMVLTLAVGATTNAKSAWAGYLSAPTLSTPAGSGAFDVLINGSYTMSATGNSSYGNTIPTPSQILSTPGYSGPATITSIADGVNGTSSSVPTLFDPSTLNLTLVASMTNPYSVSQGTTTITGNVASNVFAVGSGSTMPGAISGELVFTYQYNVTGITSLNNAGLGQASVSYFNDPNGQTYALGAGINFSGGNYLSLGPSLTGTLIPLNSSNLSGTVDLATNGTVSTLTYSSNSSVLVGDVSPQFFVASNAFYYTTGTIGLTGSGMTADSTVFVPDTPEPGTVFLFGTGLALLAFVAFRKKQNTIAI